MIVEFVGSSGAGKTTLSTMLRQRTDLNGRVIPITDLVTDRPGRRWIRDPTAVDLVADVTVFPRFVRSLDRHRGFVRFAFDRLNRHAPSRFAKVNYKREIARHIGLHELARHRAGGATVLADEGTVLTAYHLFAYSDAPFGRADLERFARLVPLPDRIVYVRAPLEVLVERALRRPDRRRELAADDREQLERSISRAIEVFDGLAAVPAIRERLLIVDDGSPDGQERALAEIAAFVSTRDGTSARTPEASRGARPAGGSHVIAFVGSEATGKSTILSEVDGWLGARHEVRRIHAGRPPSTVLTFIPHVLLPTLRKLFPDQRSTRVEARHQEAHGSRESTYPIMFAVRSVMLAYERKALLSRARSANGTIVLSDRYPSSRSGTPDGPQLAHLPVPRGTRSLGSLLRRWSTALEARLYAGIPAPNLVVYLTAPLDVTLARNAARDKTEPEDYVRWRHELSSKLEFDGAPVRPIDTDRPFEEVLRDVQRAIGEALGDELALDGSPA